MYKRFAVSAAFLLLLSSVALAQVQVQTMTLGPALNYVGLLGDGAVGNISTTVAGAEQLVTGPCHTTGYQGTVGSLVQAAGAVGLCGAFDVMQYGDAAGLQVQAQVPGVPGSEIQDQNLGANLTQQVNQFGGQGSALGLQTFVGVQTQLSFNPWGGSANVQGIGVSLYDALGGGPGSMTNVGGSASFGAGQN